MADANSMPEDKTPTNRPSGPRGEEQIGQNNSPVCGVCGLAVIFGETCGWIEGSDVFCRPKR